MSTHLNECIGAEPRQYLVSIVEEDDEISRYEKSAMQHSNQNLSMMKSKLKGIRKAEN